MIGLAFITSFTTCSCLVLCLSDEFQGISSQGLSAKSEWIAKWLDLQYRIKMHNETFAVLQLWLLIPTFFFEDEFISSRLSNN